jgi:hypothetical protein
MVSPDFYRKVLAIVEAEGIFVHEYIHDLIEQLQGAVADAKAEQEVDDDLEHPGGEEAGDAAEVAS